MSGTKFGVIDGIFAAAGACWENAAANAAEISRLQICVKEHTKAITRIRTEQEQRVQELKHQEYELRMQLQNAEKAGCAILYTALKTRFGALARKNLNVEQRSMLNDAIRETKAVETADLLLQRPLLEQIVSWLDRFESILLAPAGDLQKLVEELIRLRGTREQPGSFVDCEIELNQRRKIRDAFKQIYQALLPALQCISLNTADYRGMLKEAQEVLTGNLSDQDKLVKLSVLLDRVLSQSEQISAQIGAANNARSQFEYEIVILNTVYALLEKPASELRYDIDADPVRQLEQLRELRSAAVRELREDPVQIEKRRKMVEDAAGQLEAAMRKLGLTLAGTEILTEQGEIRHSVFSDAEGLGYNTYLSSTGAISLEVVGVSDEPHALSDSEKERILSRSRDCDRRRDEILMVLQEVGLDLVMKAEPKASMNTVRIVTPPKQQVTRQRTISEKEDDFFEQRLQ